jgi:glycosyltransferase involved in cell wall biosynthesis
VKVSAVIITFNEERNIADAVRSVSWADEVIVVDSESTDSTREIAGSLGARVIIRPWPGFSLQKQFGADAARNDWIFSLDADEVVSSRLRDEIAAMWSSGPTAAAYRVPRLTTYLGREIRHGGWFPDLQLRLFDRRRGKWNGRVVHESVLMDDGAPVGRLTGELLHRGLESRAGHVRMIRDRYAPLSALQMAREGRSTSFASRSFSTAFTFIRTYFFRLGFLDGIPGFWIAWYAAYNTWLKHRMLQRLLSESGDRPAGDRPVTTI